MNLVSVQGVSIHIQAYPELIHIIAVGNLLFTIDGFNFVHLFGMNFSDNDILICGRVRDQPGQWDRPIFNIGNPFQIRVSGHIVKLNKNLKVIRSILIDGPLANPASEWDYRDALISDTYTDDQSIFATGAARDLNGLTPIFMKFDKDLNLVGKTRLTGGGSGRSIVSDGTSLFVLTEPRLLIKMDKSLNHIKSSTFSHNSFPTRSIVMRHMEIKDDRIYIIFHEADGSIFNAALIVVLDTDLNLINSTTISGVRPSRIEVSDHIYICGRARTLDGRDHGILVKLDLNLNIVIDKILLGAYNSDLGGLTLGKNSVYVTGLENIKVDPGTPSTQEEMNQGFEEAENGFIAVFDSDLNLKSARQVDDDKDGFLSHMINDGNFVYTTGNARLGLENEGAFFINRSTDGVVSKWENSISGTGAITDITDIKVIKSIQDINGVNLSTDNNVQFTQADITPAFAASGVIVSDWNMGLTGGAF